MRNANVHLLLFHTSVVAHVEQLAHLDIASNPRRSVCPTTTIAEADILALVV